MQFSFLSEEKDKNSVLILTFARKIKKIIGYVNENRRVASGS